MNLVFVSSLEFIASKEEDVVCRLESGAITAGPHKPLSVPLAVVQPGIWTSFDLQCYVPGRAREEASTFFV